MNDSTTNAQSDARMGAPTILTVEHVELGGVPGSQTAHNTETQLVFALSLRMLYTLRMSGGLMED